MTAGPTYDASTHQEVPVNGPAPISVESGLVECWLKVRIKDYHGLPHGSPSTSSYFEHRLHTSDRYSVAFSFVPKQDLPGKDVVLGFDYDHSIKHQLPPGFKYAMKIATSMLDPGLYSDAYSDNPYLYGPALSGIFTLNIGERIDEVPAEQQLATMSKENGDVVEEGATGSGHALREAQGLPSKWKKRRKHFLDAQALESFTFEKGRMYHADFFNPHLDFANFSLRLPGFSISVAKYIDEKTHHLRFVMKNRSTEEALFVVFFKLLFGQELENMLDNKMGGREEADRIEVKRSTSRPTSENIEKYRTADPVRARTIAADTPATATETIHSTEEDESDGIGATATAAVSSLSNSIYAGLAAMGLCDAPSSSDSETENSKSNPSTQASSRSLEAQVDDMDDATIERYMQSRQGNA